jgi:NTP pyrophosphatase (non-canonical NTP hydrolase)
MNSKIRKFEIVVDTHSLCPSDLLYNSNALCGEIGEVANVIKKIQIATLKPEWVTSNENELPDVDFFKNKLDEELSDALFYLVRVAKDNGTTLEDLIMIQEHKLKVQTMKYKRTFKK